MEKIKGGLRKLYEKLVEMGNNNRKKRKGGIRIEIDLDCIDGSFLTVDSMTARKIQKTLEQQLKSKARRKTVDHYEKRLVSKNMETYGNGFVSVLGKALSQAGDVDTEKINRTFPEYWKKYKGMGE